MTVDEAEKWFGTMYQVCKALGIAVQNGYKWREVGYIPYLQQYRIAEITEGALVPDKVDPMGKAIKRKAKKKKA